MMGMDKDTEFLSEHLQLHNSCDDSQKAISRCKNKEEFERTSAAFSLLLLQKRSRAFKKLLKADSQKKRKQVIPEGSVEQGM
ncbi:uncharacterized protein DAT39_022594 [Clarias magur]|uniref:Uncharacterized protein n=1 Tax=Clarias magur TaxID=1594786 RepID=A0A8J4T2E0_CLAMG|nr:uncharacterized protein DAT39_022594 [Clarias magur]